ncbi:MAG: hypothetical protein KatS3mg092_0506 [Patescibacteria group bacterium]|nr:MAG: hypothetical protein KatS3mg092_0506 [Patescibacteria group bacterium]
MIKKILLTILLFLTISVLSFFILNLNNKINLLKKENLNFQTNLKNLKKQIDDYKSRDEYKINKKLEEEIKNIEKTYDQAAKTYEKLVDVKNLSKDTKKLDADFAEILNLLSKRNYVSAEASLKQLEKNILNEKQKISSSFQIPKNVQESNNPPSSGYSRQLVKTDVGDFLVDIVAADLSSTRVIVDTASDSDCKKDCPALPLADYISRNGGYAGINASYFCPADYPSCADKKNSFDTLLMNKNKVYFNSENNVYSQVPAVIFLGNSVRFVRQSLEWGRDTSVDGVLAMQPLLVFEKNIVFGGDNEIKHGVKGNRSFVANRGSTVYIGVVFNANLAESAKVLKALDLDNALNLDNGGSTALWYGGYKVGPGRNIPNAIVFVKK